MNAVLNVFQGQLVVAAAIASRQSMQLSTTFLRLPMVPISTE